ncbi:MAG: lecithin retinol acyltransferase family protein [Marinomonas sp.]
MRYEQIGLTGCKLVGAMVGLISHLGPKHHAIVIGKSLQDGLVYVAEHMNTGYQLETLESFKSRYGSKGRIKIIENDGQFDNVTVARRALEEIKRGGRGVYNLVTNNCECFANRAMYGKSSSQQVINTTAACIGLLAIGAVTSMYYSSKNNGN